MTDKEIIRRLWKALKYLRKQHEELSLQLTYHEQKKWKEVNYEAKLEERNAKNSKMAEELKEKKKKYDELHRAILSFLHDPINQTRLKDVLELNDELRLMVDHISAAYEKYKDIKTLEKFYQKWLARKEKDNEQV